MNEWEKDPVVQKAEVADYTQDPIISKSAPSGYARGLRDPIDGGAQLLTSILPQSIVDAGNRFNNYLADKTGLVARLPEGGVDQLVREQEQEYQAQRAAAGESGFDTGRLAGNIFNPANLALASKLPVATSLLGKVGSGAAGGALFSGLQPVTQGDYVSEKVKQLALGTATGGVFPVVTNAVAKAINPAIRPALQKIKDAGIETTIGQKLGGGFRKAEEALKSLPFVGDIVAAQERRGIEGFNKASIDRGLSKIGESLPKEVPAGNRAIEYATDKVSQYYDDVLTGVKGVIDPQFKSELTSLSKLTQSLPKEQQTQFNRIIQNEVINKFTKQGLASGRTIKDIESKLGNFIRGYQKSDNPDQRYLGDALKEAQASLRNMLLRVNPEKAPDLQKANSAFAELLRPQVAAARVGAQEGVFTPAQLRSAVRELDPTRRKKGFATGNALQQDLADAGQNILANKLPDSGTAYRSVFNPAGFVGSILGGAAAVPASLVYNPATSRTLDFLLTRSPAVQQLTAPAAQAVRNSTRYLAPGVVPLTYGLLKPAEQ